MFSPLFTTQFSNQSVQLYMDSFYLQLKLNDEALALKTLQELTEKYFSLYQDVQQMKSTVDELQKKFQTEDTSVLD